MVDRVGYSTVIEGILQFLLCIYVAVIRSYNRAQHVAHISVVSFLGESNQVINTFPPRSPDTRAHILRHQALCVVQHFVHGGPVVRPRSKDLNESCRRIILASGALCSALGE